MQPMYVGVLGVPLALCLLNGCASTPSASAPSPALSAAGANLARIGDGCAAPALLKGDTALARVIVAFVERDSVGIMRSRHSAAIATATAVYADQFNFFRCRLLAARHDATADVKRLDDEVRKAWSEVTIAIADTSGSKAARLQRLSTTSQEHAKLINAMIEHRLPSGGARVLPAQDFTTLVAVEGGISIAVLRLSGFARYKQFLMQAVPGNALYAMKAVHDAVDAYATGSQDITTTVAAAVQPIYLVAEQVIAQ
jgi:hypothetical protein